MIQYFCRSSVNTVDFIFLLCLPCVSVHIYRLQLDVPVFLLYLYTVVPGFVMTLSVILRAQWDGKDVTAALLVHFYILTLKQQDWRLWWHECLVDSLPRKVDAPSQGIAATSISAFAKSRYWYLALKWFLTYSSWNVNCHLHIWVLCADFFQPPLCKKVLSIKLYLGFSWYRCVISFHIHHCKVLEQRREKKLCSVCVLHMVLSLLRNIMMPSWQ